MELHSNRSWQCVYLGHERMVLFRMGRNRCANVQEIGLQSLHTQHVS
jgi:hypothetical protein